MIRTEFAVHAEVTGSTTTLAGRRITRHRLSSTRTLSITVVAVSASRTLYGKHAHSSST